jgi:hypothetical protein
MKIALDFIVTALRVLTGMVFILVIAIFKEIIRNNAHEDGNDFIIDAKASAMNTVNSFFYDHYD